MYECYCGNKVNCDEDTSTCKECGVEICEECGYDDLCPECKHRLEGR